MIPSTTARKAARVQFKWDIVASSHHPNFVKATCYDIKPRAPFGTAIGDSHGLSPGWQCDSFSVQLRTLLDT